MPDNICPNTPEQARSMRETVAGELWLLYFNNVLYSKGMITEKQRNRMKNKITAVSHSSRT